MNQMAYPYLIKQVHLFLYTAARSVVEVVVQPTSHRNALTSIRIAIWSML